MKRIDAIIRPDHFDLVRDRLAQIGAEGLSVAEIKGFGRQKGHPEVYRGVEHRYDLLPKLLLTIVTDQESVPGIVDAIVDGARTGKVGDGRIFVTSLDEVIRIRTGAIDKAAC